MTTPFEPTERKEAAVHIGKAMTALGLNLNGPNLMDTPSRIAKAWDELMSGRLDTDARVEQILGVTFPSEYDEMIVEVGIHANGLCPHHFFPIEYDIAIGYLPSENGCIGISKLARLCTLLAARDVLQETLTFDIANALNEHLKPKGVGVLVVGRHGCMTCRGVLQRDTLLKTTKLFGVFKDNKATKDEFLLYATSNGGH